MEKIELELIALSHSVTQTQNYAVVLGEVEGKRRLPFDIKKSLKADIEYAFVGISLIGCVSTFPVAPTLYKFCAFT